MYHFHPLNNDIDAQIGSCTMKLGTTYVDYTGVLQQIEQNTPHSEQLCHGNITKTQRASYEQKILSQGPTHSSTE